MEWFVLPDGSYVPSERVRLAEGIETADASIRRSAQLISRAADAMNMACQQRRIAELIRFARYLSR